jgi:general secretion pathway protein K
MSFPSGEAQVEVIPETAKYNLNKATPDHLTRLLLALGAPPERVDETVAAIVDWRQGGAESPFDQYYLSLTPSFRARHASFEEIEELLAVKGITPDLYYGAGLDQCVSIYGATDRFDVNTAHPAVLESLGLSPEQARSVVDRRRQQPFVNLNEVSGIGPAVGRLRIGGGTIFTLRSTARLRLSDGKLSDLRRTVAAQVKIVQPGPGGSSVILRWYGNAWKE